MSDYLRIGCATLLPNVVGLSEMFMLKKTKPEAFEWYERLNKPKWHPPESLYMPIGVALYTTMGYASYLVWRDGGGFCTENALPLTLYGATYATAACNPLSYIHRKMGWALIGNGVLIGAVAATMISFHRVNPTAGHLMIPFLGWAVFASAVSFSVWRSNKDRTD